MPQRRAAATADASAAEQDQGHDGTRPSKRREEAGSGRKEREPLAELKRKGGRAQTLLRAGRTSQRSENLAGPKPGPGGAGHGAEAALPVADAVGGPRLGRGVSSD